MSKHVSRRFATAGVSVALGIVVGCSSVTEIPRAELAPVVERDGIPFEGATIPDVVIDRLAANRVVLLGETHHLREHYAFVAELLGALHGRGFRQLLVEWPHMADWLLEDYVGDGQIAPGWEPPISLGGPMLAAIRDFNDTLPVAQRIHVRAIDVNLDDYGGATSFRNLLGTVAAYLSTPGPITTFLAADYGTAAAQANAIDMLQTALAADQAALIAAWGVAWYDAVVEMADVEATSIEIRRIRGTDYDRSVRLREDAIKRLADARIGGYPDRSVINVGGTHAQKSPFKGADLEWLGDYLVHRSTAIDGPIVVVAVVAARIELEAGAGGTPYDVVDSSPENELFRVMVDTRPGQIVFLPFDDPLLARDGVVLNFEGTLYVAAPRTHYDAALQFALAHRVPDD